MRVHLPVTIRALPRANGPLLNGPLVPSDSCLAAPLLRAGWPAGWQATRLPDSPPACLPARLPACLSAGLTPRLPVCLPGFLTFVTAVYYVLWL